MTEEQQIRAKLSDRWWRLNNLYWIIDKRGRKVKFTPNWAQKYFYNNMWFLSLILKARQLGFTTFIQIFMLDACLFNQNTSAGVIAHNREDAEDFFTKKIKYAFDNLPPWLRKELTATSDSAKKLAFSNGSSIRVGTSLRSGTYQYLHISEFGKICAKFPDKAEEIVTGALNTVDAGQFIFIESTAEGAYGRFFEMCQEAKGKAREALTKLDWAFFFFSWWQHPDYILEGDVEADEASEAYFRKLESRLEIKISQERRNWYMKKKATQRSKMTQEYPSTPEEAFQRISEYSVYGSEMKELREAERIGDFPYDPSRPVITGWDLGRSKTDATVIWFMQDMGGRYRLIDYYSEFKKPVKHYAKVLQNKPYVYNRHLLPHDGNTNDFELKDYKQRLQKQGVKNIEIVPRIGHFNEGIQAMRDFLPLCEFDEDNCADGILSVESYRYEYDEKDGTFKQPRHDWSSHAESALRQIAQGYKGANAGWSAANSKQTTRRGKKAVQWGGEANWMV